MKLNWKLLILLELGAWSLELCSAPLQPALPYPADLANNVPASADLTWAPGDTELVLNGGFESGAFTSWTRANEGFGNVNNTYINNGTYIPQSGDGPYPPYAGGFSAVTDQNGPGLISIYQDLFVPGGAASVWFSWSDRIHNYFDSFVVDPPNPQVYRVEVRNAANNAVLGTLYRTEPGDPVRTGWNKRGFDLTPYKGRTLRLAFVQEQWRQLFNTYWDNISVRVRDTGSVSYDVFFGTNAVPGTNEFRGAVTAASWSLPQLLPAQTYYWRVNARLGTNVFIGAIWNFTTAPVGPLDHFAWNVQPGLGAALSARDRAGNAVTNFNGQANLSAYSVTGFSTNHLLGDQGPSVFSGFERATVGYSFTPNVDALVVGVRHFSGSKVSIWTDNGILLGSQAVQSQPGAWRETPVTPIYLRAGRSYRIGLYSAGYATNYLRLDGLSTFAHGTLNEAYEGMGDAFPTNSHPARWWLVDLSYAVPALSPLALAPGTANFANGAWSGALNLAASGLTMLRADDGSGHTGILLMESGPRLEIFGALLRFASRADKTYTLENSSNLFNWSSFGPPLPGTGNIIEQPVDASPPRQFFRLREE